MSAQEVRIRSHGSLPQLVRNGLDEPEGLLVDSFRVQNLEEPVTSERQAQLLLREVAEGPAGGSLGFWRAGGVFGEGGLFEVFQSVADELEGLVLGWQLLAPLVSETGAPALELVGAPDQEVFLGPLRAEVVLELLNGRAEVLGKVLGPRVGGAVLPRLAGAVGLTDDRFRPLLHEVAGGLLSLR
ncbi:hypothetical protein [Streptomyces sp. AGS-58]|uniref:hypothetical protein n=1 Tax=unclassified Streptomyces TaxID=2593676 RepID=UPI0035A2A74E